MCDLREGIVADSDMPDILMPLTSAADLDKHISLSVPYTSRILEDMVQNVQDTVQREHAALWRLKNIHTQFRGDDPYAPCHLFQTEDKMEDFEERQEIVSVVMSTNNDSDKAAASEANWDTMANVRLLAGLENAADTEANSKAHEPIVERAISDLNKTESGDINNGAEESVSGNGDGDGTRRDPDLQGQEKQDEQQLSAEEVSVRELESSTSTTTGAQQTQPQNKRDEPDTGQSSTADIGGEPTDSNDGKQPKQEDSDTTGINQPNDPALSNGPSPVQAHEESATEQPTAPGAPPDDQHQNEGAAAPNGVHVRDHAMSDAQAEGAENSNEDDSQPQHRMTTRAGARAQATTHYGQPTPPLSTSGGVPSPHLSTAQTNSATQIHPFFLPPTAALPNASAGLVAPHLADQVRRQLSLYVQKQNEVVRQSDELLVGLRRALRMKNQVWDWCRSEGHVGEMSDGEDWVDMEKWGLDSPLRKGEEVDDEEVGAGMVTKKTRNRRAAA